MTTNYTPGPSYQDTTSVAQSPEYARPAPQPTAAVPVAVPVKERRSFSVRVTAVIAAVAFVLGAGAALLVGMLTGGPGSGPGGPGAGGTPPGATSGQIGGTGTTSGAAGASA